MINFSTELDLETVSQFIARLNKQPEHHVGYCGDQPNEILHALFNDFSDFPLEQSMVAAYENDRMIGVLGIDIDEKTLEGELWGPFIVHENWIDVASEMLRHLKRNSPISLKRLHGFYNVKNKRAHTFMKGLDAAKKHTHAILKVTRDTMLPMQQTNQEIIELTDDYFEDFSSLHDETFKDTYYSSQEIIERIDDEKKVFIAVEQGKVLGYVYCEATPSFAAGDIHFIGVSPSYRKRGLGRSLMRKSLSFMFSFPEIDEIILCVGTRNEKAYNLYIQSGFTEEHRLVAYQLELGRVESHG
ncbi:GNAT family N-acetyltransferase [Pseudalkalibacillus sp. SCS-8]|uniref:GNAT family N-acetyltransferase n=1 Tax=Pseudalkalibacillus nanhaiensis TaxID=3115291 RepID=UPI0032DB0610